MTRTERRNLRNGLLFVAPWLVGFIALQAYPIFYSGFLSLTEYGGFGEAIFVGLDNYRRLFADPLFGQSAYNTLYYTLFAVPVGVVMALAIAIAMNQKVKEVAVYRAILYLPSILPSFALVFIWILFTNPQYGLLTGLFGALGLPQIDWVGDPKWTKPSVVILAQFGAGGPALIFLAALRGIPKELQESAEIDGAGSLRRFFSITLPMITPVILYDIILGLSLGLQAFTQAYIMTSGGNNNLAGPSNSLLFYVYYIYKSAFQYSQMGYAAALSVVLFAASLALAVAVFVWGRSWVHYENE
jgi:multiple sugar transport system permease protein